MSEWAARRFWREAGLREAPGGWEVVLDGRPVRAPSKAPLVVPTLALAEALAAEWNAVGDQVDPTTMPWTRSANSAVDKVAGREGGVVEVLADYGGTDLLSYRAEGPDELVRRQAASWDPLIDWASSRFGARLSVTAGVMPVPQDAEALRRLRAPLEAAEPFALTALHDLVVLPGSLVLGLAAAEGWASPEVLWRLSRIDEEFQAEQWGRDEEAEAAAAAREEAFLHAHRFLIASRGEQGPASREG